MISESYIIQTIQIFSGMEEHLDSLTVRYQDLEKEASLKSNELLRKWYWHANETYAINRRRVTDYINGFTIRENSLTELQYARQIGEVLSPFILVFVNKFEYISNLLFLNSKELQVKSNAALEPIIQSLEQDWKAGAKMKEGVINSVKYKIQSSSFQRKILKTSGFISKEDFKFLSFVWDLRNAMHNNFIAHKNIKYKLYDPDTNRVMNYEINKGEPTFYSDTPKWNIVICESVSEIMIKVIKSIKDVTTDKNKLKSIKDMNVIDVLWQKADR